MAFHPPQSAVQCYYCGKPVRKGPVHERCKKASQKRDQVFLEKHKNSRPFFKALLEEYWIYPGERRPVVVKAAGLEEARDRVHASPEYDGFGGKVYTVEEYAKICQERSPK